MSFAKAAAEMQRNPWPVVIGSILALFVCNGPIAIFTFGLFLKPVSQEFGWARGTISTASGLATLMIAIAAPLAGICFDRWGIRRVLLPIVFLFSLSFAAISLTRASPVTFVALYAVMGLAAAGQGPQPYVKAIAAWFDRRRGLALGIAMVGPGLGIVVMPQIARVLIETHGWRNAYIGLGAISFALAFPAVALLVREPAAVIAHPGPPVTGSPARIHDGLGVLIRTRRFWLLAAPLFLVGLAANGTLVHLVPLLTDRGMSVSFAASVLSAAGLASVAGRLLCGYLSDRFFAPYVAAVFFGLPCVGIYLLMVQMYPILPLFGAFSVGLALGCELDMLGLLTTRYFGMRRFGEIYGYLFALFAAGSALGPYLMGVSFDTFHSYDPMLVGFVVALLLASLLISGLGSYRFPVGDAAA